MTLAQTIPESFASERVLFVATKQPHPFSPHVLFISSPGVSGSVIVMISLSYGMPQACRLVLDAESDVSAWFATNTGC
jgi:hypothetical protein